MPQLRNDRRHGHDETTKCRLQDDVVALQLRSRFLAACSHANRRGALLVHRAAALVHVQSAARENGAAADGASGVGDVGRHESVQSVAPAKDHDHSHDVTSRRVHADHSRHVHASRARTPAAAPSQEGETAIVDSRMHHSHVSNP